MPAQTIGERLRDFAAGPPLHWNQTRLAKEIGVTPETLRKWITGEIAPNRSRVKRICEVLLVTPEWVAHGMSPVVDKMPSQAVEGIDDVNALTTMLIPLLTWSQVTLVNLYNDDEALNLAPRVVATSKSTKRTKHLQVPDDAMHPTLQVGDSVQVEPGVEAVPGDVVLVKDAKRRHYLREFRDRGAGEFDAAPHNTSHAVLQSGRDGLTIEAVVTHVIRPLRKLIA